ncbi:MAG TPA: DUF885 domain-containing protein, partial [Puia sp.]
MKKILIVLGVSVSLFSSCKSGSPAGSSVSADSSFQLMADEYIKAYLDHYPMQAVSLGFHVYDGKLTDDSRQALDSVYAWLKVSAGKLATIDTNALSKRTFIDYRILRNEIRSELYTFEDIKSPYTNPMGYAGAIDANTYVKRNFAPAADRLKSIIAIENAAPAYYENAKANLRDSLGKPLVELAIKIAKGSASFLGKDLPAALSEIKNDTLRAAFNSSNKKAIDAINGYADWLQKEKLPTAHNHYAIGRENYMKMLLNSEDISMTPEEVLEIGLTNLKKEQEIFNAAAKIINPHKKPVDVYNDIQKDHPVADSLIPDSRKTMESIRQYLIDKHIVSIPSELRVEIKETPPYARETSTASMDAPGPFDEKATESYYYITPVDRKWTPKQQEDWLKSFNYYTTDVVTIHEVYPGHYTQYLHLKASSATRVEKIFSSYAFVEGWAHYTEKMMLDEGYGNNGDSIRAAKFRLAQSGDALLRLCRLCVSVKTHTQGMTVDEGTKFFMDNWYQGDKPSRQEALRGTFDPGYLFYTIGKLEILKLRSDYQQQEGNNYSLQKFHDLLLDNGQPPIRLLREILLKDSTTWD